MFAKIMLCMYKTINITFFHRFGPLGRFSLVVAISVRMYLLSYPYAMQFMLRIKVKRVHLWIVAIYLYY